MIASSLWDVGITRHFQSNELAFPSLAKYVWEWRHDPFWFSWWDIGMPLENAYLPLIPWLIAALHGITGVDYVRTYHAVLGIAYFLGTAGVYVLAKHLSRSSIAAGVAAAVYSFVSISAIIFPEIRDDLGSVLYSRRLHTIVFYGEGPHNVTVAILPFAILAAIRLLEARTRKRILCWLVLTMMMILTNPFGAAALVLALIALVFANPAHNGRALGTRTAVYFLLPGILLTAFVPAGAFETMLLRSQTSGGDFRFGQSWIGKAAMITALLGALHFLLRRRSPETRFMVSFLFLILSAPGAWFWFQLVMVPQPKRYHLEVELAVALVIAAGLGRAFELRPKVQTLVAILAITLLPIGFAVNRQFSHQLLISPEFTLSENYAVLEWVRNHIPPDSRVMAGGELGFALNLFVSNPQISSGHEPSSPNSVQPMAIYTIYSGENAGSRDAEISVSWLRALGATHLIMQKRPACPACIQPFRNPVKFEGVLEKVYENSIWRIYATGAKGYSDIRIAAQASMVPKRPLHGLDVDSLRVLIDSIDSDRSRMNIQRLSPGHLRIKGTFHDKEVVQFVTTYSSGWRATLAGTGQTLPMQRDGLDLMYFVPPAGVPCEIALTYHGGAIGTRLLTKMLSSWK